MTTGTGSPARCWVPGASGSGFDVDHLPFGVFQAGSEPPRVGVRIGDHVLAAGLAAERAGMESGHRWEGASIAPFLALGPRAWQSARDWLTLVLTEPEYRDAIEPHLHPVQDVTMLLPLQIGDYVDFYASDHHASALGRLFRPDSEPLLPNWKHLPVGYHGRSGTVVVSGTPIIRPRGQLKAPGADAPTFGPSVRLDIEAELGFLVGTGSTLGTPVSAAAFADTVFGVTLVNDWSARDIQSWEYVPLGPFLGKSFGTSISPWITPLAALAAARVPPRPRTVPLLDYLADDPEQPWGLDISLEVAWNGTVVSRPPYAAAMYYTPAQMLAHLTVNGASVRTGDLYASGTISGPEPDQAGSFIELTAGGRRPVSLADGSSRTFLKDGDTVTISASAPSTSGGRLTLGSVTGTIQPART
ncbi:MAG TPA: fumarylacetoacetase [Nakamurella sp.]|nr:fumarylacetoacetase [Nakamurella sp.]